MWKDWSTCVFFSSIQTSACMCLYISGTLCWGRWPPPVRRGATSLPAPRRRSTTWRQEFPRWCLCLWTASQLRGGQMRVPRAPPPPWRVGCYCGWDKTDSTPADCVRAGCTGREDCPSMETSSTNWRERSPVNSSTRRTTWQVRQGRAAASFIIISSGDSFGLLMIYNKLTCHQISFKVTSSPHKKIFKLQQY